MMDLDAVVDRLAGDAAGITGRHFHLAAHLDEPRGVLFEERFAAADVRVEVLQDKAYFHSVPVSKNAADLSNLDSSVKEMSGRRYGAQIRLPRLAPAGISVHEAAPVSRSAGASPWVANRPTLNGLNSSTARPARSDCAISSAVIGASRMPLRKCPVASHKFSMPDS